LFDVALVARFSSVEFSPRVIHGHGLFVKKHEISALAIHSGLIAPAIEIFAAIVTFSNFSFSRFAIRGDAELREVAVAESGARNGAKASARCVSLYSLVPNKYRKCRNERGVSIVLYYTNVYARVRLIASFYVALLARFSSIEFSRRVIHSLFVKECMTSALDIHSELIARLIG